MSYPISRRTLAFVCSFALVVLAGRCFDPTIIPICKGEADAICSTGDEYIRINDTVVELIIQLNDGLDRRVFDEQYTLYACSFGEGQRTPWRLDSLSQADCDGNTVLLRSMSRDSLVTDINNFLFEDPSTGGFTSIGIVDTCRCDSEVYLLRATHPPDLDINNGIAKTSTKTREENKGTIRAAGFNYAIALQPINDTELRSRHQTSNIKERCFDPVVTNPKDPKIPSWLPRYELPTKCIPTTVNYPSDKQRMVTVAIVDTGVDPTYAYSAGSLNQSFRFSDEWDFLTPETLQPVVYGAPYFGNGGDDNGNCIADDYFGYDFFHDDNNPSDKKGHGTHIAGTILTANKVAAATPVRVLPLQFGGYTVGDTTFSCNLFSGICAISYAAKEKADVINLSWGFYSEYFHDVLYQQVKDAGDAGAVVVGSAGNDWVRVDSCTHYPSGFSAVPATSLFFVSVAALARPDNGQPDALASYSNFGTKIDLAAPGSEVNSALVGSGTDTIRLDGTSMAAAVVSRQLSLMRYQNGQELDGRQLKSELMNATRSIPHPCLGSFQVLDYRNDRDLLEAIGYD